MIETPESVRETYPSAHETPFTCSKFRSVTPSLYGRSHYNLEGIVTWAVLLPERIPPGVLSTGEKDGICRASETYLPLSTLALEFELMLDGSVSWREGHVAELGGQGRQGVFAARITDSIADNEAHDLVGVEVDVVIGDLLVAAESYVLSFVGAEVHNDFPSLGH